MSIVFTRHGNTGAERNETAPPPPRQPVIAKAPDLSNLAPAQPKTIADYIKTYGQTAWQQFRNTILATPSTVAYLQATDTYAKQAMNNLLLRTEADIAKRVIEFWEQQLASQKQSTQDGLSFIAERWAQLDIAAQKFASAFTGAFVGTPEQMKEQMQGGTVYYVPKKLPKGNANVQSPIGPIPVGEMNDPVGKIVFPEVARYWLTSSSTDLAKAIGQALPNPKVREFLTWCAKQTAVLFRRDVADRWADEGLAPALANFGNAIQSRVNLLNSMQGLPDAIANNKKFLANEAGPQIAASDKALEAAQSAALEALKKVGAGVPTECATATAAVNFELTMAMALLQAQSKLSEAVKAGLNQSAAVLAQMEELQQKLIKAQSKAEKELIAAQIIALAGAGAADLSRSNKRLGDRKGKIGEADARAAEAVKIADAHGLDGNAARAAAQTVANQVAAATDLNTAHGQKSDTIATEIEQVIVEVLPDAGSHATGAAGEIVAQLKDEPKTESGGGGALWLVAAAAAAAKFLL